MNTDEKVKCVVEIPIEKIKVIVDRAGLIIIESKEKDNNFLLPSIKKVIKDTKNYQY